VTGVPVLIVRVAGLKAKFLIAIEFDPPAGARVAGVGVGGLWTEVQPANKQEKTSMIAHSDQKIIREFEVIVSLRAVRNKKGSCRIVSHVSVYPEFFSHGEHRIVWNRRHPDRWIESSIKKE
jgi:hypothetical protein